MSFYRSQLEEFLKTLDVKAGLVLDIGGAQGPVKDRVKSWHVKNYDILDLPDWDLQESWHVLKAMTYKKFYESGADVVFCLEVFEYLIDPLTAIRNIAFVLRKGGTAYISVPLIYPVHNELEIDAIRFTENGFKRLCAAGGLQVNKVHLRRTKNNLLTAYYAADGMKAAKGVDHEVTGYIFEVQKP